METLFAFGGPEAEGERFDIDDLRGRAAPVLQSAIHAHYDSVGGFAFGGG